MSKHTTFYFLRHLFATRHLSRASPNKCLERIFSKMSEQDLEKPAGFVVQLRGFQEFATPSFSGKIVQCLNSMMSLFPSLQHIGKF